MRVFAIGDVHLPGGPRAKAMDRFGEAWIDHARRVREAWASLAREDDVLVIAGDLSWAMTLDEARDDVAWIASLPGRKVVIRGNHDFWWSGIGRVRRAFGPTVNALQSDHVVLDGVAFVGTRGWQCPGTMGSADFMTDAGDHEAGRATYTEQDATIYRREVERLKLALTGLARAKQPYDRIVVVLHYPPMNPAREASGFTELIDEHRAAVVVHGHLHGPQALATAFEGTRGAATYHCVSADHVRMVPRLVLET